jgi:hypothetical protein
VFAIFTLAWFDGPLLYNIPGYYCGFGSGACEPSQNNAEVPDVVG